MWVTTTDYAQRNLDVLKRLASHDTYRVRNVTRSEIHTTAAGTRLTIGYEYYQEKRDSFWESNSRSPLTNSMNPA